MFASDRALLILDDVVVYDNAATFGGGAHAASSPVDEPLRYLERSSTIGNTDDSSSARLSEGSGSMKLEPGRRVRACVGKSCPRADRQMLLAVSNSKDPEGME